MSKTEEARELCLFSPEGSHLAISRMDGEVQVWEVASGRLKLRFSPGGARARPASCLSWSRQLEVVRMKDLSERVSAQRHVRGSRFKLNATQLLFSACLSTARLSTACVQVVEQWKKLTVYSMLVSVCYHDLASFPHARTQTLESLVFFLT